MNAIDLLKQQHREVESLFAQIETTKDSSDKLELVQELADQFAAHGTIEERIFYPTAYAKSTSELLEEAVEEHLSAKRILADLLDMQPSDEHFDAKIKVLKEQIEHHVKEEESELFPKVRAELDEVTLASMGEQMEELFEDLLAASPGEDLRGETKKAPPVKPKGERPSA